MARKWEGFNDRALRILQLANQAALATHCKEICTEHLLLALLRVGDGAAPSVLRKLGVDLAVLKSLVVCALPVAGIADDWRKVPFSALAERVFDHARQENESLPSTYIGTSHLFLGLLKVEEGGAFKLLQGAGVTYDRAREEVVNYLKVGPRNRRIPRRPSPLSRPDRLSEPLPPSTKREPLIEETKRSIRGIVVEIVALAKQDVSEPEFFVAFLARVVSALAAKGGAVWMLGEGGKLALRYQYNLPEKFLAEIEESGEPHRRLLKEVLPAGIGALIAPHSPASDGQAGNTTDYLLVVGVLQIDGEPRGVVELFQRPGAPPATQRGYLKFLQQMCELANDYLRSRR